ncbi:MULTISPECIES: hypothetical protein [unclassified Massilia]|nr:MULTISPECIES: hypothetical protein [unclassified Massilia]MBD8531488.1 hypothetical protein [Massilia sp. CFBP 13647]MBD8673716.1 hypothetical protein [Massilia sp. CFBP 13721]
MKTKNEEQVAADPRPIPTPPSGGSWTFDRTKWEWVSNDPVDPPAAEVKE